MSPIGYIKSILLARSDFNQPMANAYRQPRLWQTNRPSDTVKLSSLVHILVSMEPTLNKLQSMEYHVLLLSTVGSFKEA